MDETSDQMRERLLSESRSMVSCRIDEFEEIYRSREKWRRRWLARLYNEAQLLTALVRRLEGGCDPYPVALAMNDIANVRWPDKDDRIGRWITSLLRSLGR